MGLSNQQYIAYIEAAQKYVNTVIYGSNNKDLNGSGSKCTKVASNIPKTATSSNHWNSADISKPGTCIA